MNMKTKFFLKFLPFALLASVCFCGCESYQETGLSPAPAIVGHAILGSGSVKVLMMYENGLILPEKQDVLSPYEDDDCVYIKQVNIDSRKQNYNANYLVGSDLQVEKIPQAINLMVDDPETIGEYADPIANVSLFTQSFDPSHYLGRFFVRYTVEKATTQSVEFELLCANLSVGDDASYELCLKARLTGQAGEKTKSSGYLALNITPLINARGIEYIEDNYTKKRVTVHLKYLSGYNVEGEPTFNYTFETPRSVEFITGVK